MAIKTVTMHVCDKCNRELSPGKSIQVKGSVVRLDLGGGEVCLVEGEYCADCAAAAVGHTCPEVDPPLRDRPRYPF